MLSSVERGGCIGLYTMHKRAGQFTGFSVHTAQKRPGPGKFASRNQNFNSPYETKFSPYETKKSISTTFRKIRFPEFDFPYPLWYNCKCEGASQVWAGPQFILIRRTLINPMQENYNKPGRRTIGKPYSLDFSLASAESRTEFLSRLLSENPNLAENLTQNDYDLFVDYICCGIGAEESQNPKPKSSVQKKETYLENKRKSTPKEESLDALLETPTFNEGTSFARQDIHYKIPKPNFSRERIRSRGQEQNFKELWTQIDELEKLIGVREGKLGAEDLGDNFQELQDRAQALDSYHLYLAKKLLLDLRKTQYTLDDFYNPQLQRKELLQSTYRGGEIENGLTFDTYVNVLPLGLYQKIDRFERPWIAGAPYTPPQSKFSLDFTNPTQISIIIKFLEDLKEEAIPNCESAIPQLVQTLTYYASHAHLSPEQQRILQLKIARESSAKIAQEINEEFGTSHTDSYISTIFTQQICEKIAWAAQLHKDSFEKRGQPRYWKECKDCGAILLKDERNFTKSSRSRDGFQCRCKWCERKKRKKYRMDSK